MKKNAVRRLKEEFNTSKGEKVFMFHKVINHMGKKLKVDPYDFYNSSVHFDNWCDLKGYGNKDPDGKKRSHSNIWYLEYQKDIDGKIKCPPHVCIMNVFADTYPELFPFEYIDDLEGTETYVSLSLLLKNLNNEKNSEDVENKRKWFIEGLIAEYGENVYLCEQRS